MTAHQRIRPATQVITGVGRASYAHVFEPKVGLSGKSEWSLSFLIPKDDEKTLGALRKAAKAAMEDKWPDPKRRPSNLRNPIRDGDEDRPDDAAYAGHYFINVSSKKYAPGIVDRNMEPVTDPRAFCSGDYCRVSVNAYGYDVNGNRGVSFGLNNIQVIRKGEPLTGSSRPESDFDIFEADDDDLGGDDDLFS